MRLENKLNVQGLVIWFICAIFYTYELLLRTILGTFQIPIMNDLSLNSFTFALMSTTCYLVVYAGMQIPAGILSVKYGLKKTLIVAVGLCALSTLCFAHISDIKVAIPLRMLVGLGSSFGFICLLIAVYDWMPKKYYGLFVGLSQFVGLMGPMFAAGPLNSIALKGSLDWRTVLFSLGVAGVLLMFLIICFVKSAPQQNEKFRIISKKTSVVKSFQQLLKQRQIWLIAMYSALVYFTLEYLSENEGKAFLELNGYSSNFSSYMITMGWIGCAIGCPILGTLSDVFKRRKYIMVFASFCCLISFTTIVFFPISKLVLIIAFLMLGLGAGGQSIGFAIMAEQCSKTTLAIGLGINNAMITLLMSFIAPTVGGLLSYHSGTPSLHLSDYHFAFSLIILLIAMSLFLSVFCIKETYCRPTKEYTIINWMLFLKSSRELTTQLK